MTKLDYTHYIFLGSQLTARVATPNLIFLYALHIEKIKNFHDSSATIALTVPLIVFTSAKGPQPFNAKTKQFFVRLTQRIFSTTSNKLGVIENAGN
jgi:hypothetical protein